MAYLAAQCKSKPCLRMDTALSIYDCIFSRSYDGYVRQKHIEALLDSDTPEWAIEMFGSFDESDGVYPAYHMNKLHWISVLLPDAPKDVIQFLVNVSFEATKDKRKRKKVIE